MDRYYRSLNPFTPKSDQSQISPAASPEILYHTVWRTWLFVAYSDERWLYYQFSLHNLYVSFIEDWENLLQDNLPTKFIGAKPAFFSTRTISAEPKVSGSVNEPLGNRRNKEEMAEYKMIRNVSWPTPLSSRLVSWRLISRLPRRTSCSSAMACVTWLSSWGLVSQAHADVTPGWSSVLWRGSSLADATSAGWEKKGGTTTRVGHSSEWRNSSR